MNDTNQFSLSGLLCFYANTLLSLLAGNMYNYSMIILTKKLTGSDGFTGLVFFTIYIPTLLFSFYAGTLLDRMSRLAILFIFQVPFILAAFGLGALLYWNLLTLETRFLLLLLALFQGITMAFIVPGRLALVGNLVPYGSIGRVTITLNVLIIIGFGVAPILVGNLKEIMEFDSLLFSIGCLYLIGYLFLVPVKIAYPTARRKSGTWLNFKEGFNFIRETPLVAQLIIFAFFSILLLGPVMVLLPTYATKILGLSESGRGWFLGTLGAGLFTGGILARFLHDIKHKGWIILISPFAMGLATAGMAQFQLLWLAAGMLFLVGIAGGLAAPLMPAVLQMNTPDQMRGRVMSFYGLVFQVTPGVSGVVLGSLSDKIGLLNSLAAGGLFVAASCIFCTILMPALRKQE